MKKTAVNKGKEKEDIARTRSGSAAVDMFQKDVVALHSVHDLNDEHHKLLYMISRYTEPNEKTSKRRWIRAVSLLVLMYEGTIAECFDYDYAPSSEVVGGRRVYMNISQEGRDDLDDLREAECIAGLKLSSNGFYSITCYQLTDLGREVLSRISQELKNQVDEFLGSPVEVPNIMWDAPTGLFMITMPGEEVKPSSITDTEDVSYVSSPYLPDCVRSVCGRPLTNNRARASEAAAGVSTIRDELSEAIILNDVKLLVSEWIPFGENLIALLNEKLGATERVKGGLFTAVIDDAPEESCLELPEEESKTQVNILDFDYTSYLNFQAEVNYEEEEGVVQVEHFGVHLANDGHVVYGLQIDAIMNRNHESVSLDHLARLLVDIHQDSSKIMESVISSYQRKLLNMMFAGHQNTRDKFNAIIATDITPHMKAIKYMDKEDYENELKQVVGETQSAHDLGNDELFIVGSHGVLLVGKDSERHSTLLIPFLSLMSRKIFISNFVLRMFVLADQLGIIRKLIHSHAKDPNSIPKIRSMLSSASREVVTLHEVLGYVKESLEDIEIPPSPENDAPGVVLHGLLDSHRQLRYLIRRVADLQKNVGACQNELDALREGTDVISETQMFRLQEAMQSNTKNLELQQRSSERASNSLEIMQVILSGALAFDIADRMTGEWSVLDTDWGQTFLLPMIEFPGLWFGVNLVLWAIIAYCLMLFMNYLAEKATGVVTLRFTVNREMNLDALRRYLGSKKVQEEEISFEKDKRIKRVAWEENCSATWFNSSPKIELCFDDHYLLTVYVSAPKTNMLTENNLRQAFFAELIAAGVILTDEDIEYGTSSELPAAAAVSK